MKKLVPMTLLALLLSANASAVAVDYSAVNKDSCSRLKNSTHPFILVLSSGDDLMQSITQCAMDAKLPAATITGLGQVHNPTLAYFTSNPKDKPTLKQFDGYFELASLNGDVTNNAGKYYTHLHATLADHAFRGIAGHIKSAEVGMTVEVTIFPLAAPVERAVNADTGFGPIVTK